MILSTWGKDMKRRQFVAIALAGALPSSLHAQPPKKVARIGWLEPATATSSAARIQAFKSGLRALGRVEGQHYTIEFRFTEGKLERFRPYAQELVGLKPDCIFVVGINGVQELVRASPSIPIVMGTIDADPVKEGTIASLARPGGNVTGLTGIAWELAGKRLEILTEVAPKAKRVAVVFDPRSRAGYAHVEETQAAAKSLGVELQLLEARQLDELDQVFRSMRDRRAEALSLITIGLMQSQRPRIVKLALESRLPAIYSNTDFVVDGGLMSYAPDITDQFRRAALFVDKILKGTKPADLPVEQPTRFELAINMKTAKALGITFPPTVLVRAERIIE
jgi:putative ABC transport system substrate-binding protein